MGPKAVALGKVYFLKSEGNIGDAVDITEYILGGDFNMNPNEQKRTPGEIDRDKVLGFVEHVLGVNPALVHSVHIENNAIEVELAKFPIVD